jgi:streptogramin lyase
MPVVIASGFWFVTLFVTLPRWPRCTVYESRHRDTRLPDLRSRLPVSGSLLCAIALAHSLFSSACSCWGCAESSAPVKVVQPCARPSTTPATSSGRSAGHVTEFPFKSLEHGSSALTFGQDGNLWYTEEDEIGRITPAGKITPFPLPQSLPMGITCGPDGNFWFTDVDQIGRITPRARSPSSRSLR